MENIFNSIKSRLKLIDYVSKHVRLKSVGNNKFVGLCPFHQEKTASFHVNSDTDLYHCFGCGKGGDVISFYCGFNNCDTKKALVDLSRICGLEFNYKSSSNSPLGVLLKFFTDQEAHLDFLRNRNVSLESIKKFKLGWSPSFTDIQNFLSKNQLDFSRYGFKPGFLKFFQNRVVFPIFDEYGVVVSFGGRCLDNRDGKYINGADSDVFHKSEILYGLNFVKSKERIFLVEGYLDVIMMQQNGYSAVASMGTAVSKLQIEKLWKHTNEIVVCMDGDAPGRKAAYKVALLALECIHIGKEMNFLLLDQGEDPDSYLNKKVSLDGVRLYPLYEFFIVQNKIPEGPDKKAFYFKRLLFLADKIQDSFLRSEYKKKWNEFRWSRGSKKQSYEKLKRYTVNDLILLLFKYVFEYKDILDHVAEDFLKLRMDRDTKENLILLLNGKNVASSFEKKIDQINSISTTCKDWDFDKYLEEWYKIFNHVQCILSNERESRLLEDFSEEGWDLYKQWLAKKEEQND